MPPSMRPSKPAPLSMKSKTCAAEPGFTSLARRTFQPFAVSACAASSRARTPTEAASARCPASKRALARSYSIVSPLRSGSTDTTAVTCSGSGAVPPGPPRNTVSPRLSRIRRATSRVTATAPGSESVLASDAPAGEVTTTSPTSGYVCGSMPRVRERKWMRPLPARRAIVRRGLGATIVNALIDPEARSRSSSPTSSSFSGLLRLNERSPPSSARAGITVAARTIPASSCMDTSERTANAMQLRARTLRCPPRAIERSA